MHKYWLALVLLIPSTSLAQPINRLATVRAVKARISPTIDLTHGPGECGRFEVTKRVAWELRAEGAGFLAKTGAQNKCNERNTTESPGYGVDILMYTDGTVVDILGGGSEGPNTPLWLILSPAPLSSWRPPFDPGDDSLPPPLPPPIPPTPDPPPPPIPVVDLLKAITDVRIDLIRVETKIDTITESLEAHRAASRSLRDRVLGFLRDPRTIATALGILAGRLAVP